jgi:hypothetical protein
MLQGAGTGSVVITLFDSPAFGRSTTRDHGVDDTGFRAKPQQQRKDDPS